MNPVRWLPIVAFVAAAALCWFLLFASARTMRTMDGDPWLLAWMVAMMRPEAPGIYLLASAAMWALMMVAMMIPAALPMALVYQGVVAGDQRKGSVSALFTGYLLAWTVFSIIAALAQYFLHRAGYLHGMDLVLSRTTGGVVLLLAGLYQFSPLKDACLSHCRSPLSFVMEHWHDGATGGLRMGVAHGLYCLGCCWLLMLIMFAGGTMSLATMAILTTLIVAERALPSGPWVRTLPGLALTGLGIYYCFSA